MSARFVAWATGGGASAGTARYGPDWLPIPERPALAGAAARKPARSGALVRLAVATATFCATILLVHLATPALGAARGEQSAGRGAVLRLLARDQILRLESALEVYRVEHGEYSGLAGGARRRTARHGPRRSHPFRDLYQYRRTKAVCLASS